jgi:hypothetical protein
LLRPSWADTRQGRPTREPDMQGFASEVAAYYAPFPRRRIGTSFREPRARPPADEWRDRVVSPNACVCGLRRCRLVVSTLAAIGLAGLAAGCTPATPRLSARSPLAIDTVWTSPKTQVNPLTVSTRVPQAIIVHWNSRDYSMAEIRSLATQQCLAYDRVARPSAAPSGSTSDRRERFACVRMVANFGSPTDG